MKRICVFFTLLFLPGMALAQTSSQDPHSSVDDTNLAAEVKALREALQQTQKQLVNQQHEIEALKEQSKNGPAAATWKAPTGPHGSR